jgi:hypothetical protein
MILLLLKILFISMRDLRTYIKLYKKDFCIKMTHFVVIIDLKVDIYFFFKF